MVGTNFFHANTFDAFLTFDIDGKRVTTKVVT
jgi:hypothetical protein